MKKRNVMKLKLSIVLLICLISCTPKPPDVPICENLQQHLSLDPTNGHLILKPSPTCIKEIGEIECGHCTYIVTGKEIYLGETKEHQLNNKPWSQIKAESVLVPSEEAYAPLATYMINACKKMNCNDDLTRFKVKIESLKNTIH